MSEHFDIADAVRDALNAASFTQDFTATVETMANFELEDLATLRVTVVPEARPEISLEDRATFRHDYDVAVWVGRRAADEDAVREMSDLVEEIIDALAGEQMGAGEWMGMETTPAYDPLYLRENRCFRSRILVTYRSWR